MVQEPPIQSHWRRATGRDLGVIIALKVLALALLWWLFFSPAHRTPVDGAAVSRQLGVQRP
jgi:type II secretory pathway component PulM